MTKPSWWSRVRRRLGRSSGEQVDDASTSQTGQPGPDASESATEEPSAARTPGVESTSTTMPSVAVAGVTAASELPSDSARPTRTESDLDVDGPDVPRGVQLASAWSWRFLVIAAAIALLLFIIVQLRVVVVPVAVAILLSALVVPAVDGLQRLGLPRGAGAALTTVGVLIVVFGLLGLVGQQIASGFSDLSAQVSEAIDRIHAWLLHGPLGLTDNQIIEAIEAARQSFEENQARITRSALSAGTTIGHVIAGFFITLFATIFFLYQGDKIWSWVVRLFPRRARVHADGAGRTAWVSLTSFVRATVLVAFVDAVGITVVALLLDVPLALAIGVLVFLMSFIPIIGAVLSGAVAVLVAFVAHGALAGLLMVVGVLGVQQLESQVLQPFLLGRLVRLHPLAILLAIAAGSLLAGIIGALFAVPVVAVLNGITRYLRQHTDTAPAESG